MSITITELASKAKVSVPVISRFVNGDKSLRISGETRLRIESIAEEHGGLPAARQKKTKQSDLMHHIVMPVNNRLDENYTRMISHSVSWQIIVNAEQHLMGNNFRLGMIGYDPKQADVQIPNLFNPNPLGDGILFPRGVATRKAAEFILKNKIPHVSIHFNDEALGLNTVLLSERQAFADAIAILRDLGHKKIGYIGTRHGYHRRSLIVAALLGAGYDNIDQYSCFIDEDGVTDVGDFNIWTERTRRNFGEMISGNYEATAYLCSSDEVALGAVAAIRDQGMTPGKEISIVGFNDLERRIHKLGDDAVLTTIDNPVEKIGERAAALLLEKIESKNTSVVHERVQTKVIVRKTTGKAPC